jgi:hypothetical protein
LKKIAHRGNTHGVQPHNENKIDYLLQAIGNGYYVECDVQLHNGELWLGHDAPQELLPPNLISSNRVFFHAKCIQSFELLSVLNTNTFMHVSDPLTITTKGQVWCYPGNFVMTENSIWLDLLNVPLPHDIPPTIFGICSDDFTKLTIGDTVYAK